MDPDGREQKIPVPLTGVIGTSAHNTAYPLVTTKIASLGYTDIESNKGMISANGMKKISRSRPDWQTPTGDVLLIWEMKPNSSYKARKDILYYIALANTKGEKATAGPVLGVIAERVPLKEFPNIFIDIYSNEPGVVIYNAYTIISDTPIPQNETENEYLDNTLKIISGATLMYLVYKIVEVGIVSSTCPPLLPAVFTTP